MVKPEQRAEGVLEIVVASGEGAARTFVILLARSEDTVHVVERAVADLQPNRQLAIGGGKGNAFNQHRAGCRHIGLHFHALAVVENDDAVGLSGNVQVLDLAAAFCLRMQPEL